MFAVTPPRCPEWRHAAVIAASSSAPAASAAVPNRILPQAPIARSGFGRPNVSTATFTATYNITDTSDPSETAAITEVPL